MANTLTDLIPTIYQAMYTVSHELTGLIPAVTMNSSAQRCALNQTIRSFIPPAATSTSITPAPYPPDTGGQAFTTHTLTIANSKAVPVQWTGEEELSVADSFTQQQMMQRQFEQAMRTLANEIEADLAALYAYASRAYGTVSTVPGTTAGDYTEFSGVRKLLVDNGAPTGDLHLVVDTTTGAMIRGKQSQAYMAGSDTMQRQGVLYDFSGLQVRESAQIKTHTAGNAASATTNNAGYAVGATTLTLASAGTGALLAGDIVTFAGDANQYVVTTGDADVSGGGTFVIANPGLRIAMSAATKAITEIATHVSMMAFDRGAIHLATRLPALNSGRDMATARSTVTDPYSGLSFDVAEYLGYHQTHWEVSIAWGVGVMNPHHLVLLIR